MEWTLWSPFRTSHFKMGLLGAYTSCGAKVGVPLGKSAVAFLPFLLAMVAARHLPTFTLAAIAWLVGAAAMFILWFTFVPLVKK